MIYVRVETHETTHGRGTLFLGGNLQPKLARSWAGVAYLWLGYPGRGSGSGQPDSPSQSPELTCDRWVVGTRKQISGAVGEGAETLPGLRGQCLGLA